VTPPTTRIQLRIAPGSRETAVVGRYGSSWKIRVAAAPERGRANSALIAYLARELGIAQAGIKVVAGATGRDKLVELPGIGFDEVERRLAAAERGASG
jgi:uncharacterized protein